MKKYILTILVTAIVFTGIGVFATIEYQANEIGYGTGTVKDAIDDLYTTANTTITGLNNQIDTLTENNSSLENQVTTLTNEKNELLTQTMGNRVLYIYNSTYKTSSWSSKNLGYGFYQNGRGYLSQQISNNLYYLTAVKACKIRATLITWNGDGAATNAPQIKLYKNDTEVLSVTNTKTNGDFKASNVDLMLNIGDTLNFSTYGAGNVYSSYLVYFEFMSE